jgi:hypothetical protein
MDVLKMAPKKYGDRITNEIDGKLDVDTLSQILKEIDGHSRGFPAVKGQQSAATTEHDMATPANRGGLMI